MAEGMNRDWTPGDYAGAEQALNDLQEALNTMAFPDLRHPDKDQTVGRMFEDVLRHVKMSVENHKRVVFYQEATRPAGGLIVAGDRFIPGTFADGKFTPLG